MSDEIDISKLCDCVAGGRCRVRTRTAETMHRIRLFWADRNDQRDPNTVASPVQLDEWIRSGVIVGAACPECEDVVTFCPSFRGFLTADQWADNWDDR